MKSLYMYMNSITFCILFAMKQYKKFSSKIVFLHSVFLELVLENY